MIEETKYDTERRRPKNFRKQIAFYRLNLGNGIVNEWILILTAISF